ncbi:TlpA family protein disulfide reductase [Mucilaginibacter sp. ZT4R22]|uniref:TlpA family protein disulfide reductase n=1 Tax=Mucilaginibacter pankratovii TaxID=2772110 RepID=A0ABR7WWB0_9SPHI|nr:TlpA disulfide reductase family protein [Mucilaginibacter pankratovii]MBD1366576.1 TlpA family protein disulfide reductase [Mucilaginibacter pankratovii]
MKKIILNLVLAVLCLNFTAHAQNKPGNITALKIGDQVPDITINNIINYKDANGQPATNAKISDFKGKLLILDFWATWCSPCVAMIPKMDSLQKEFAGKMQFLPVAYQSEQIIGSFLEKFQLQQKKRYDLPDVTGDTELAKLFPHTYLPHYVWINDTGTVVSITEYNDVNSSNIAKFLGTGKIAVRQKIDVHIEYDRARPLLIGGNGGDGSNMLYHTLITGYTDGLLSGFKYDEEKPAADKPRSLTATNQTIPKLYALAYGEGRRWFGDNRMIIEVKEPSKLINHSSGQVFIDWMKTGSGFSYEVIVPPAQANQIFTLMQNDLNRFFTQYSVSVKTIPVKCLALVRTSNQDKLHSKGGPTSVESDEFGLHIRNNYIGQLTSRLDAFFLQGSPFPVVDATGFTGRVDMDIDANLSNVADINRALQKYDLKFEESVQNTHMLIFRDKE